MQQKLEHGQFLRQRLNALFYRWRFIKTVRTIANLIQAFRFSDPHPNFSLEFGETADYLADYLFERISLNTDENRNLIVIRDALLPLLSGKICVRDAEKVLGAMA